MQAILLVTRPHVLSTLWVTLCCDGISARRGAPLCMPWRASTSMRLRAFLAACALRAVSCGIGEDPGQPRRQCGYCPRDAAAGSRSESCGTEYFNASTLDAMFAPFASIEPRVLHEVREFQRKQHQNVARFVVRNRRIFHCGRLPGRMAWPLRLYGVAFLVQQFLATASCAEGFDFEFFVVLPDGPFFTRKGIKTKRGPVKLGSAFPAFCLISMPSHFVEIPLPWHDHVQTQLEYLAQLDAEPVAWEAKASVVEAVRGRNTWSSMFRDEFRAEFGKDWPRSHRVAMCTYPSRPWARFGITGPTLGDGGNAELKWISSQCAAHRLNASRVPWASHAQFKYQLYLDGATISGYDSSALRAAGLMLATRSLFRTWMGTQFEAGKHHVPVRADLADLEATFRTLEANPSTAERIFREGERRMRALLEWPAIECYLCGVFSRYQRLYAGLANSKAAGGRGASACSVEYPLCPVEGEPAPTFYHRSDDQRFTVYRRKPGTCSGGEPAVAGGTSRI